MRRIRKIIAFVLVMLLVISMVPMTAMNAKAEDVGDFVNRCYSVALGRNADSAGYQDWYNKLVNGEACGAQVGFGFIFSAEYQGKNKTNEAFVTDLYSMFFGRTPDEGGYNNWVGQLNNGISREEVFAGFANSQEFFNLCMRYGVTAGYYRVGVGIAEQSGINCFVSRLYNVCLDRQGDQEGQAGWSELLMSGWLTGTDVAYCFIFSEEFTNKNCSDSEYIDYLYEAFFGRPADQAGKSSWLSVLSKNKDREEVFAGFANSAEFKKLCDSYGVEAGEYIYIPYYSDDYYEDDSEDEIVYSEVYLKLVDYIRNNYDDFVDCGDGLYFDWSYPKREGDAPIILGVADYGTFLLVEYHWAYHTSKEGEHFTCHYYPDGRLYISYYENRYYMQEVGSEEELEPNYIHSYFYNPNRYFNVKSDRWEYEGGYIDIANYDKNTKLKFTFEESSYSNTPVVTDADHVSMFANKAIEEFLKYCESAGVSPSDLGFTSYK